MRLRALAPAKVNLYLHVGRPRPDGLHPLDSIAAFADLGDVVTAEPDEQLSLELFGPFAAALAAEGAPNLALTAAMRLAEAAGVRAGARLALEKRLPIASGIGGGSADAAAALRLLDALWGLKLGQAGLQEIARGLGADVPACLASAPVRMTGAGEIVRPVVASTLFAVLVNPAAAAPTAAVYRAFDAAGGGAGFAEGAPDLSGDAIAALAPLRNDLTDAAISVQPAIARVLERLGAAPEVRLARLSGSGATCFGLCPDAAAAAAAARRIAAAEPHWWVAPARLGDVDARAAPL